MKIIVMMMIMTDRNQGKFYNMQDLGLCKALAAAGHNVSLYNFVHGDTDEEIYVNDNLTLHYIHGKSVGVHTFHKFDFITEDVDAVVCYSDNQMNYRKVVNICKKNNILLLPYVGVIGSHNRSAWKTALLNFLISNERIYKNQMVLAKTPEVKRQMLEKNIKNVIVAPACLDTDQLNKDYYKAGKKDLREQMGFKENHKIILFIGRMIEEKWPLEMLEIFLTLYKKDSQYRLIMIGKGDLLQDVKMKVHAQGFEDKVKIIEQIDNSQMWQYYRISDAMINLNRVEIFGMAILEAMYYECLVIARRAPGPEYILTDSVNGFLCDSTEEILKTIELMMNDVEQANRVKREAHLRIVKDFMWESTAAIVLKTIQEGKHWKK